MKFICSNISSDATIGHGLGGGTAITIPRVPSIVLGNIMHFVFFNFICCLIVLGLYYLQPENKSFLIGGILLALSTSVTYTNVQTKRKI